MLDKRLNFIEIEKKTLAKWEKEKLFLFQDSDNYKIRNSKNASERLLEICIAAKADIYVSGPSAKNYLDIDLFKKHNVKIEWFKYVYSKHYFQKNREILINNLSIIDYILRFGLDKKIFN